MGAHDCASAMAKISRSACLTLLCGRAAAGATMAKCDPSAPAGGPGPAACLAVYDCVKTAYGAGLARFDDRRPLYLPEAGMPGSTRYSVRSAESISLRDSKAISPIDPGSGPG